MERSLRPMLALVFLLSLALADTSASQTLPARTVGVSVDGDVDDARWLLDLLQQEFGALLAADLAIEFPDRCIVGAEGRAAGAARANDVLLADPELDLVIALGPIVSADLVARRDLAKPSIALMAWDAVARDLPLTSSGTSGVRNLTYVRPVFDFGHDVARYRELVPFDRLAVIASPGLLDLLVADDPDRVIEFPELGLTVLGIASGPDAVATARAVPDDVQAALLVGVDLYDDAGARALLDALHARGVATFSTSGERGVREGALAGLTPQSFYPRLARRAALLGRRLLEGEPAADMNVRMTREEQLFLNMDTARRLSISPTFDLMSDATIIGSAQRDPERTLDLVDAVREALANNRDLQSRRRDAESAQEDVALARSILLPQLDAALAGRLIDEDRARQGSAGAERTLAGRLGFSQVLWSEPAWAGVAVQRHLLRGVQEEVRAAELDVALEVSSAYFAVLTASADERIRRENLRLTRSNLERARLREQLGAASPAEVYRWDSQIAQDQDALVTAVAQRNLAEIQLNRVLSLPLEAKIGVVEPRTREDVFRYLDERYVDYIDDQNGLRILRAFAAEIAKEHSPELAALDAAIEATRRQVASTGRSFYSPELALEGAWTHTFDRWGEGAALLDAAPIDDQDLQIDLGLRLPLFSGGERLARRSRARIELLRLERQREAVAERVEQRIRSAVHVAAASYTRIGLTRRAAEAASKNFELVSDAYARGAVSIIELLDAQNAALNANTQSASATFRFLSDVMEVERASGDFFLLATAEQRDAWIARLEAFAHQARTED